MKDMREVDLGNTYIPDSILSMVEKHKKEMLENYKGTDTYDILQKCTFSMWFSDYLLKYGYKLLDK